jgi:hypothetical protein
VKFTWYTLFARHRTPVYMYCISKTLLRLIHTYHAVPIPFPCHVNSHMPCRTSTILRQCRVLRESPRGRRKYPNCIWDWYASGNNLRGTPRGSRKNPNAGRSPTCRLWTADANSHIPCRSHAALCRGIERLPSERHGRGMAWERHRRGMACVNQTQPHRVNQMGKT